jgi:hypothetical protein
MTACCQAAYAGKRLIYREKGDYVMDDLTGRKAPDAQVLLSDGSRKKLSGFWESGTTALVFLRHFG